MQTPLPHPCLIYQWKRPLQHMEFGKGKIVQAIGKAAWQMAKSTTYILEAKFLPGIVITKYL